ncbi:MAG: ArsR family transcriptional regulator [Turneriella sp.]|nr:ArsR family transcriptional regulator [Turneriella sp.]
MITKGNAHRSRKKAAKEPSFTFLTNHSHVLVCLAQKGDLTLREVAQRVGITERAVVAIVRDLAQVKVLTISKKGRRNVYQINPQIHLRHPVEQHKTVGDLLRAILD